MFVEAKGVTFYKFRIGSGSSWQGMQIKDNFQNVTHNANDPITVRRKNREGGGTSVMLPSNIHTVTLENLDRSLATNATAS